MAERLTESQIDEALSSLNATLAADEQWQRDGDKITKTFTFKSFIRAFGWMSQIAIWAEKLKHHPEWFNVYNRVEVALTTHDVDGLSELDFSLAEKMEKFR
ncbi:4a-hydroxytetrahydrobiopterin dehydratase [Alteromonas sp. ASW11-19]|uniref:Putative pterin-4-alpha-carbinolamine dehydratase n=1 Tax=Alteromonas salexigens TaxID=2982530 RepID=A0ABT2VR76_9ALTE|nr:4a-hydroxytetrahydrobiopterin dehydratase [Alteromonas salexigens]MCU7555799.1 4a-hydroxytetrahydrobiopterin dehydratase [Alteromonas salexigens]